METGRMDSLMSSMKSELRSNPVKWAGIAAGAGFALGVLGRVMRHRTHRRLPDFVIIEAC